MAELSARNLVLDTAVQEGVPEQDLPADAFDDQNDETRQVEHTVSRQLEEIGNEIDPGLRNTEIANEATNSREGVQGFFQNWRDMLLNETTLRRAASLFSVAGRLVKEFLRYTTREITLGQLLGWIVQALHDEAMPRVRQWVQESYGQEAPDNPDGDQRVDPAPRTATQFSWVGPVLSFVVAGLIGVGIYLSTRR